LRARRASSGGGGRAPRRKAVVAAFAVAAALCVFPALAGADPTGPPSDVATGAATAVTNSGATLNGTVDPNDPDAGADYTFSWGTDTSYGQTVTGTSPAGTTDQAVSEPLTGLSATTTYHYELCATNTAGGPVCGGDQQFTTAGQPGLTVNPASSVANKSATLSGTVDPNGDATTYVFHYDTSSHASCSGYAGSSSGGSVGAGNSAVPVSDPISNLTPNTTYYFRLSATNTYGTPCSAEGTFTTQDAPTPTAGAATAVKSQSATLSGSIDPNGASLSSAVFKYCTGCANASGGASVSATLSGTDPVSATANLTGLASGATFHYTLCATNTWGTRCDAADHTFTTDTPPTAVLTADKTTGPVPLTVNFDGSGSSDPDSGDAVVSYTFDFGDGSPQKTQASPTIKHIYSSTCSPCTATLTVTDKEGAQSSPATVVIHANTNVPPTASLTATPTKGTVPLNVSFDGSGSSDSDGSIASWSLDFGDQSSPATGTGAVPNAIPHTYNAAGTYHPVLTVTDSSNAQTSSTPLTITVNQQPSITIGDLSQNEGNSGTTSFVFPVTLSSVSSHDVTVDYKTADGTATAGSDYTATSGTLKIPAGTDCTTSNPSCAITVPVTGDTIYESNETFTLTLSNPTAATIADGTATGTIVNDDQAPLVLIDNGATLEGNAGSTVGVTGAQSWSSGGTLQLDNASGFPQSFGARTFYISTPGSPAINGPYTYTGISGNALDGIKPAGSIAVGQIAFHPNPLLITVLLCDPQKTKPSNDPGACVPTTSGFNTTVKYKTTDGHSLTTSIPVVEGQDYVYSADTLNIPAGQTSGTLTFQTIPNTTPENPTNPGDDLTRWFNVLLSAPTNATIGWGLGTAKIIDDDVPNPPTATTGAASAIGTDHATVAATVNPKGPATQAYIQYGLTEAYGSETVKQSLAAGSSDQSLSFSLTGLVPGTTYHYRVVATHSDGGTAEGQDATFTTDKPPVAVLQANKTSGSMLPLTVTFNGSGSHDPDGSIASWSLSFGDGISETGTGPVPSAIPHAYASPCSCVAGLTVTDNQGGRSTPATVSINVGPPKKGPNPKLSTYTTAVGPTSAKIVFPVDPNGAETRVWVEYGATSSYGRMSTVQTIPAGSIQTLTFPLPGLTPATTYHYALFAAHTTDSGAVHSQDLKFSTPALKWMKARVTARSVRAKANGAVSLPVSCGGNALGICKGRAMLKLGHLSAGSTSFSVRPGTQKRVSVKLKKAVLKQLLAGSGLQLVVSLSVQTGAGGTHVTTAHVRVLPPGR
jgi:PKD repeat protein